MYFSKKLKLIFSIPHNLPSFPGISGWMSILLFTSLPGHSERGGGVGGQLRLLERKSRNKSAVKSTGERKDTERYKACLTKEDDML